MSSHTPSRWTYAEFAKLPEGDGNRYEIIAGDLYVTPTPALQHQRILTQLLYLLHMYVRKHRLGEVIVGPIDVLFAEGDYLEPDLVFVRKERREITSERGIEAAPDLVAEVLSPSTADRDRLLKRDRYQHFGVAEYWVVDPDAREILVYRSPGDPKAPDVYRERLAWRPSPDAPALEISVPDLFGEA